jgi:hypothetical protein
LSCQLIQLNGQTKKKQKQKTKTKNKQFDIPQHSIRLRNMNKQASELGNWFNKKHWFWFVNHFVCMELASIKLLISKYWNQHINYCTNEQNHIWLRQWSQADQYTKILT